MLVYYWSQQHVEEMKQKEGRRPLYVERRFLPKLTEKRGKKSEE